MSASRHLSDFFPLFFPQNGVLKSLSFLFEYIGEMGKDYIYAVTPLLEDALMDRDLVHRQTAASAVQHMALGVAGLGCEDALIHLLNFIWPNIFETSPHVINAVMGAVDGMRVAVGPAIILNYCLQVRGGMRLVIVGVCFWGLISVCVLRRGGCDDPCACARC